MHIHNSCLSCGSAELFKLPITPSEHSHVVVGDRVLQTIAIQRYICTDCGRVEEWVNSEKDLRLLKEECEREHPDSPQRTSSSNF